MVKKYENLNKISAKNNSNCDEDNISKVTIIENRNNVTNSNKEIFDKKEESKDQMCSHIFERNTSKHNSIKVEQSLGSFKKNSSKEKLVVGSNNEAKDHLKMNDCIESILNPSIQNKDKRQNVSSKNDNTNSNQPKHSTKMNNDLDDLII
jgi:hypothetical protein